jgi:hypothetical protein
MSGHVHRYGLLARERIGRGISQSGNASRYGDFERVEGRRETSHTFDLRGHRLCRADRRIWSSTTSFQDADIKPRYESGNIGRTALPQLRVAISFQSHLLSRLTLSNFAAEYPDSSLKDR